ncbi:MAG: hypothetical protein ACD_79C00112G0002 [uncultured bacterium]|nr:MAG: hypothetical protein ACD_79C00112G0002 [uncultured bacterium]
MNAQKNIFMNPKDKLLTFADKVETNDISKRNEPWKLLIVDDEEEVHKLTRMVLGDYTFDGKPVTFLSAYTALEAQNIINGNHDIALILLDVVMETDNAGLELIKYIREDLANRFVRIILRTGQPGQAPEHQVIVDYDINDYKSKLELTAQKLFTTVTAALRAYRDIVSLEVNRRGLEHIISFSPSIFEYQPLKQFSSSVLNQIITILQLDITKNKFVSGFAAIKNTNDFVIISATGKFYSGTGQPIMKILDKNTMDRIVVAVDSNSDLFGDNFYVGFFESKAGTHNIIYIEKDPNLNEMDKNLIKLFISNVSIAFDNINLNQEVVDTQKELIFTLGEVVENRSKETANHVRRVAELSKMLALKLNLSIEEAELLRLASPMHDVGKLGIPDFILNKPGKLSKEEFEIMKKHTLIGFEMLKNSFRKIMQTASIVAYQHHERWDGCGYPQGFIGEQIHIFSRITCIADVVDALSHKRIYKEAWALEKVYEYVKEQKGKHFDPELAEIFLANISEYEAIQKIYPEEART